MPFRVLTDVPSALPTGQAAAERNLESPVYLSQCFLDGRVSVLAQDSLLHH